jgi:hypothetical protein
LTVKGQKEEDKVEKKQDCHLRERRFGSFTRSVHGAKQARRVHDYNWHRPHGGIRAKTRISKLGLSEGNLLRLHS